MNPPQEPDIRTGTADSILAGLWRQIKKELGVDDVKLESLIDLYSLTVNAESHEHRTQIRGNLRSELAKDTMTWKTFMKGIRVLRTTRVEFLFVLHHVTLISQHKLILDLAEEDKSDDEESAPKRNQLSDFFHNLLNDLGIDLGKFDRLLSSYMVRAQIPITTKNRTHLRGNLKKELLGPKLSWRSLVKGFNFLCVVKFELRVQMFLKNNPPSEHNRVVILNDIEDFQDAEERTVL